MMAQTRIDQLRHGDIYLRAGRYVYVSESIAPLSDGAAAAGLWRIIGFIYEDRQWKPVELRWVMSGAETVPVLAPDYAERLFAWMPARLEGP
jgi:hypothetical protein